MATNDSITAGVVPIISQVLLNSYGTTQWSFAYHNLLGNIVGAGLTGVAFSEAYTFYMENSENDLPHKVIVAWLLVNMTAAGVMGTIGSLKIVQYWGSYVLWLHDDMLISCCQTLIIATCIYPVILSYYSLRAWSTNGRSKLVVIMAALDITMMLATGIAAAVIRMRMPWSGDVADLETSETEAELQKWGSATKNMGRVWSVLALVSTFLLITVICNPLFQLGRRSATPTNGILKALVWSLAVEVGPIVIIILATVICIFTTDGLGGWGRPLTNLIAPILCHSVFHSLSTRKALQSAAKALGVSVRSHDLGEIPYTTTINVEVSEPDEGNYLGMHDKDSNSRSGSTANLAEHANKPDRSEMQRREFMRYAKAWEQPLVYSWTPQKYDFKLGAIERDVVF